MKKKLFSIVAIVFFGVSIKSQTNTATPAPVTSTPNQTNFDKKFRFGLRGAIQPTWYTSDENNNKPFGTKFGLGFGLNMEYRFSDIVAISMGIGGDFEGGKYSFRYDPANNYSVRYWQNNAGEFVEPKKGDADSVLQNKSTTGYLLKERSIKTTFVTIPLILKLSTSEYNGFKYFGMFGGEIGIRIKTTANDTYSENYKYNSAGIATLTANPPVQESINLNSDASLIPLRVGLNAGLGMEYRLGGSTSVFMSVNYFRSFTNLLKKESKYLVYNVDNKTGSNTYNFVKQNLILNAVRINFGILF